MFPMKETRILSIQSHVVSGYVGNKCATFPLQLLGFEVDTINSVQLSNHTGYKIFKGQVLNDKDLDDLADGLERNGLDNYTHILTGYIGSASFLKRVASLILRLKCKNPNVIYVCDPVMGDNGKMYVPEELKEIYKKEILQLVDVITPNQFELELLTDQKVTNMIELQNAIVKLQSFCNQIGSQIVAVSSTELNDNDKLTAVATGPGDTLMKIDIPKIPATFTGSGDLFAALFLAHTYLQSDMKTIMEKTINSLYSVLLNTYEYSKACAHMEAQPARNVELRLIQSKSSIEKPELRLFAESIRKL